MYITFLIDSMFGNPLEMLSIRKFGEFVSAAALKTSTPMR